MLLKNVSVPDSAEKLDIRINGAIIEKIYSNAAAGEEKAVCFEKALVIPGLINSHDHLCLDLFPKLGSGIYRDYKDWVRDVQTNFKAEIRQLAAVPKPLLYQWGILKNLVNGVTTVVQHGPFFQSDYNQLLDVHTRTYPLHSLSFEPAWRFKVLRPTRLPIVMHLGEGTGEAMEEELRRVKSWNVFGNEIIPVHGLALTPELASKFPALIWCPESNYELYGSTVNIPSVFPRIPILFGSDSTISSSWNIWQHLRRVSELDLLKSEQLLSTLTINPAKIWKLGKRGRIEEGYAADLIIVDQCSEDPWETFYKTAPSSILMVVKAGKIVLCDDRVRPQIHGNGQHFHKLKIDNTYKWIAADVEQLINEIKASAPTVQFPFGT